MTDIKTKPTSEKVEEFLETVTNEGRRQDLYTLLKLMEKITGEEAVMWGSSIVGFGKYHYRYDSGHEGEMCRTGFSPRKANLVVYLLPDLRSKGELLKKLGKHKSSVTCLYINKLSDIDIKVLEQLIRISLAELEALYPSP